MIESAVLFLNEFFKARNKRYLDGDVWTQPSGRRVTKKNGEIIPVKKGREPSKKTPQSGGSNADSVIHSEKFKRWFGDWEAKPSEASKVVDQNGRPEKEHNLPIPIYHGTQAKFTEFKKEKIGAGASAYGRGFYFTNNRRTAERYVEDDRMVVVEDIDQDEVYDPHVITAYLNIRKPFDMLKDMVPLTKSAKAQILDKIRHMGTVDSRWAKKYVKNLKNWLNNGMPYEEFIFHDYGLYKYFADKKNKPKLTDAIRWGMSGNQARSIPYAREALNGYLRELGYDGLTFDVVDGERHWIAFEPNQIKSIDAKEFDPSSNDFTKSSVFDELSDFFKGRKPDLVGTEKPRKDGWMWKKIANPNKWKRSHKIAGAKPPKRKPAKKKTKPAGEKKPRGRKRKVPKIESVLRGFDTSYKKFIEKAKELTALFDSNYVARMQSVPKSSHDIDNAVRGLRIIMDDLRNASSEAEGGIQERLIGIPKDHALWVALKEKRAVQIAHAREYTRQLKREMPRKLMNMSHTLRQRFTGILNPVSDPSKGVLLMPEYASSNPPYGGFPSALYNGTGSIDKEAAQILRRRSAKAMWMERYVESSDRYNGSHWVSNGRIRVNASFLPPKDRNEIQARWYGNIPKQKSFGGLFSKLDDMVTLETQYSKITGKNGKPKKVIFQTETGEDVALPQGYVKFFLGINPNVRFRPFMDLTTGLIDHETPVGVYSGDSLIGMIQDVDEPSHGAEVLHELGKRHKKIRHITRRVETFEQGDVA